LRLEAAHRHQITDVVARQCRPVNLEDVGVEAQPAGTGELGEIQVDGGVQPPLVNRTAPHPAVQIGEQVADVGEAELDSIALVGVGQQPERLMGKRAG
jgi:hypothetical protein